MCKCTPSVLAAAVFATARCKRPTNGLLGRLKGRPHSFFFCIKDRPKTAQAGVGLPSNRRRLPSNRRRLPSSRRRLLTAVGYPPAAVGYPPTAVDYLQPPSVILQWLSVTLLQPSSVINRLRLPSSRRGLPSSRRGLPSSRRGLPSSRRGLPSNRWALEPHGPIHRQFSRCPPTPQPPARPHTPYRAMVYVCCYTSEK